jgi:hypothetical protein
MAWRGVQLRDAGPLPRNSSWPPSLLSVYLERSGADLGLDPELHVTVSCGQPPAPQLLATAIPRQVAADSASTPAGGPPDRPAAHSAVTAGTGPLAGFSLTATAAGPVACGWTVVDAGHRHDQMSAALTSAYAQLRSQLDESPAILAARLRAIGAALTMAGDGAARTLSCARTTGDGWALLQTETVSVASAVVGLSGVSSPVAVAILTSRPAAAPPGSGSAGRHAGLQAVSAG